MCYQVVRKENAESWGSEDSLNALLSKEVSGLIAKQCVLRRGSFNEKVLFSTQYNTIAHNMNRNTRM